MLSLTCKTVNSSMRSRNLRKLRYVIKRKLSCGSKLRSLSVRSRTSELWRKLLRSLESKLNWEQLKKPRKLKNFKKNRNKRRKRRSADKQRSLSVSKMLNRLLVNVILSSRPKNSALLKPRPRGRERSERNSTARLPRPPRLELKKMKKRDNKGKRKKSVKLFSSWRKKQGREQKKLA